MHTAMHTAMYSALTPKDNDKIVDVVTIQPGVYRAELVCNGVVEEVIDNPPTTFKFTKNHKVIYGQTFVVIHYDGPNVTPQVSTRSDD